MTEQMEKEAVAGLGEEDAGLEESAEPRIEFIGEHEDEQAVEGVEGLSEEESVPAIEALLLAHGEPLSVARIREVTRLSETQVRDALETIQMSYESEQNGFELVQVGAQYQFRTKPKFGPYIQALKAGRPRRLTQAALETLAIIAYRQPVVKSDIEKIRGVDATPTLKTLLERRLVRIVGHKAAVGQPALYGTGDEFLRLFGLASLGELPTLRDIKEFEADPGETVNEAPDNDTEGDDEPGDQEIQQAEQAAEGS